MNWRDRSYCGSLRLSDVGREVTLLGWVDARRDHGDVCFVHLRDWTGIVQVVFSKEAAAEVSRQASGLRLEFCIKVSGKVSRREPGTEGEAARSGGFNTNI